MKTSSLFFTLCAALLVGCGSEQNAAETSTAAAPAVAVTAPEPVAPTDTDLDGVFDPDDACPDTAAGIEVDASGCKATLTEAAKFHLNVDFGSGSARFDADNVSAQLVEMYALAEKYPETRVEVAGYTDSSGNDAFNERLSAARAKAVGDLITGKVAADRITTVGRGEADPVADNDTPEGRAANRRIVVTVQPAA